MGGTGDGDRSIGWIWVARFRSRRRWKMFVFVGLVDPSVELWSFISE